MSIPITLDFSLRQGAFMLEIHEHIDARVVALFGPTSSAEIELFGSGRKIVPEMDCLVCYKAECDFVPNCMDLITSEMVKNAISAELAIALGRG
ncbi:MAG: hypothetical protein IH851_13710 [Armatimonadetes bacterium]|nr:hypothetical protein [Armatimonadota bacterium]